MYKSWSNDEDKSEWADIGAREHITQVREAIARNFPDYFTSLVKPKKPTRDDLLDKLRGKFEVYTEKKPKPVPTPNGQVFETAIEAYEKESKWYRDFFQAELLQEYRDDDPDAFKSQFSKKCPIIRKLLRSKREVLKEWRIKYHARTSEELLTTFERLIGFADEYIGDQGRESQYAVLDSWDEFDFEGYDDDEAGIPGVIGGGIKSLVLFHLHPRVFPKRNSEALWGLYFLTGGSFFSLRSKSSEFLMINDRLVGSDINIKMDHNYWYSYHIFTSYAIFLAKLMEMSCRTINLPFDCEYRHVYVDTFLEHVCERHAEQLETMRGGDDLSY